MTFKDFLNELDAAKLDYYYEEDKNDNFHYLTFKLENDIYAVDIDNVEEVVEMKIIIETENTRSYIKGMVSYKKTLIDLIDLRLRLDMKEKKYDYETTIIITNINNSLVGLIVDDVIEITSIPLKNIEFNHGANYLTRKDSFVKGISRIDNKINKILDLNKIVYGDRLYNLNHVVVL